MDAIDETDTTFRALHALRGPMPPEATALERSERQIMRSALALGGRSTEADLLRDERAGDLWKVWIRLRQLSYMWPGTIEHPSVTPLTKDVLARHQGVLAVRDRIGMHLFGTKEAREAVLERMIVAPERQKVLRLLDEPAAMAWLGVKGGWHLDQSTMPIANVRRTIVEDRDAPLRPLFDVVEGLAHDVTRPPPPPVNILRAHLADLLHIDSSPRTL